MSEATRRHSPDTPWAEPLTAAPDLSPASALAERLAAEMEADWRQGRQVRAEEVLARAPEDLGPRAAIRVIYEEVCLRHECGQPLPTAEVLLRFPQWRAELKDFFDCCELLHPHLRAPDFPEAGQSLGDFQLLAELGRGANGLVFLATQPLLADRPVVLKLTALHGQEHLSLARLQHTHIMPLYWAQDFPARRLRALCMPYLGGMSLAQVLSELRGRPPGQRTGRAILDVLDRAGEAAPAPLRGAGPAREFLAQATYVQAVCWVAACLADALHDAHQRGLVHLDLKPANVLLAADGQPLLLDFHLAREPIPPGGDAPQWLGGTPGYMAPEQEEAFAAVRAGRPVPAAVGPPADLYALGVLLYELLTGRHPFPRRRGPLREVLPQVVADRRQPPPSVRRWNPAVTPAAEAIVQHCLEPEPERRYPSARALREDLLCQLNHLPLKHVPEPSLRERARKWAHRHPRLTSATTVAAIAAVLLAGLVGLLLVRDHQLTRLEAATSLRELSEGLKEVQFLLSTPDAERQQREEGKALGRRLLERFRVLETPSWQEARGVSALSEEERRRLREDMGELLLLMARETARQAEADPAARQEELAFAGRLNRLAEGCYPADAVPRALWLQRGELARQAGDAGEARRLRALAEGTPLRTPRDHYLLLAGNFDKEHYRAALPFLREASRQDGQNYSLWLVLGNCNAGLGKPAEAAACYDKGIALRPNAHWAYFNRGLACLEQKDHRQARADFDEVIRLRPDLRAAYYNRSLARSALGDLAGARADLTHLLETGPPQPWVYYARARVREKEKDRDGAREDRDEVLRQKPLDEKDWTVRGLARLERRPPDPKAAMTDFDQALRFNPRYRAALQNKASVLSEYLGRAEDAVAVLDRVVDLYPDSVPARAGRGVLLARLGRREAAHADAREALQRDGGPANHYQVAGIYALTSRENSDDRREAFRLLASALRQGYGFAHLKADRDLDPIRGQPEFSRIVEAAQALRAAGMPFAGKP